MAWVQSTSPSVDDDVASGHVLARQFSERFAPCSRYVAAWKCWMLFNGVVWRPDTTLLIHREARATCSDAADAVKDPRVKASICSGGKIALVERLARTDRRHAARPEQWDADPLLLNTPEGTIDLRTGDMHAHRPEDYITQITAVAPEGDAPLFQAFLARIFANDAALIGFVQRALGYALTGVIAEHALFFAHGTGGNGKSVLLNTVIDVLGGYAAVAPTEALIATKREGHAADLASLRAARLVVAQETAQGRSWDEDRIKALTGGDRIIARHRQGEAFTYQPRFKLLVAGNHKPSLRTVDAAIRRRLKLIPFAVTIPETDADPHLRRKLEPEWPGILAWMIAGCREWQRIGLAPPAAVLDATAAYLAEEDTFGAWLEECVTSAPESAIETTANLFASWASYAERAQEAPGSRKAFGAAMQARGFVPCRIGNERARGYQGLVLRRQPGSAVMLAAVAGRKMPAGGSDGAWDRRAQEREPPKNASA